MKQVITCTEAGEPTGTMEIVAAHSNSGTLHQAFSILIFRNDGTEVLLQKRSSKKPLFANHWANTCCSHPIEGEDIIITAERRLQEELGFTVSLKPIESFVYKADDPNSNYTEYEYDTVMVSHIEFEPTITPDPTEVADYKWVNVENLTVELEQLDGPIAPWLPLAWKIYKQHSE